VPKLKEVIEEALEMKKYRQHTILFVDEIHRFNKLQQDALLPHVESGTVTLIGATTENPSFECNAALLSRCKVFVMKKLTSDQLQELLKKASKQMNQFYPDRVAKYGIKVDDAAVEMLANICDGDARASLTGLEMAYLASPHVTVEEVKVC
jgi:putative ATPase